MSAATASGPCLSDLPEEALQLILYVAPAREAASTALLARRWRSLWPTPWGGVNLDSRSYDRTHGDRNDFYRKRDAFFLGAGAALAAHGSVRRLTIRVDENGPDSIRMFMFRDRRYSWSDDGDHDIADEVLSHPACRRVEELHVEAYRSGSSTAGRRSYGSCMPDSHVGYYDLGFGSVLSEALRVLHITNCSNLASPPPASAFPCLSVLRLQSCGVSLDSLQDMVFASPQLATLHLEYVFITTEDCLPTDYEIDGYLMEIPVRYNCGGCSVQVQGFCCPTVTTLVLENCCYDNHFSVELDAPRVRHFRYSGHVHQFPLKSPPPDLRRVDLHVLDKVCCYEHGPAVCNLFCHFVKNFRNTKVLKLTLACPIEDIAAAEKKRLDELLGDTLFGNLEHLEVDGKHKPASKDTAVAIGNLLQCCPAVADLRVKLNIADDQPYRRRRSSYWNSSQQKRTLLLNRKAQLDFRKSVNHFMRRKNLVVSFGGDDGKYEVSDIPGLSDKWFNFNCLQFYLKRVSLQFHMDKSNAFGVQLANFFYDRAMVVY